MEIDDILLVDDDPAAIQLLASMLEGVGSLRFAVTGADALRMARERTPDLVMLDAEMPGMSGFDVCQALQADPLLATVPVIFVTSHSEPEFETSGFDFGASDFICKPVNKSQVQARVKSQLRLKHGADELRRLATVDPLTGTANRRRFDAALECEWLRAQRHADPLSLLMIDVDHFKLYNDHYGHPGGDRVLRAVAQAMAAASLRPADVLARYGGEEFAMLLPQTPRAGAEHVAQRLLAAVAALAIPHAASPTDRVLTISVGIGCCHQPSELAARDAGPGAGRRRWSVAELVQAADSALYAAKQGGRAQARALDVTGFDGPATRVLAA